MAMDKVFGIAGSALAAQLVRMNTTASNLANAANTSDTEDGAYKAKRVVFRTLLADQTVGEQTRYAGSIHMVMSPTIRRRHLGPTIRATPLQMQTATFTRAM
jgi:flagellar basal-body rod protein FlgC